MDWFDGIYVDIQRLTLNLSLNKIILIRYTNSTPDILQFSLCINFISFASLFIVFVSFSIICGNMLFQLFFGSVV